jgi:hypothetical protein
MTGTRSLSPHRRFGACIIATLDERQVGAWARGTRLGGHGTKRPLAVLIATPQGTILRDAAGRPLAPSALDALRPGTLAEFRAGLDDPDPRQTEEETTP